MTKRSRRSNPPSRTRYYVIAGAMLLAVVGYLLVSGSLQNHAASSTNSTLQTTSSSSGTSSKPVILYVNQGNGVVNSSNFGDLLTTATSHDFNTLFFQVYRSGTLLFDNESLLGFVTSAHGAGLKIFFALYFTNSTQTIPTSIYSDGEDGISLDMSTLSSVAQTTLFNDLSSGYSGKSAITTTDPTIPLKPDLLVVETYNEPSDEQYIHPGMIAGVEVVATTSQQDYQQQVQYALANSDGVLVFDYAGLVKSGY